MFTSFLGGLTFFTLVVAHATFCIVVVFAASVTWFLPAVVWDEPGQRLRSEDGPGTVVGRSRMLGSKKSHPLNHHTHLRPCRTRELQRLRHQGLQVAQIKGQAVIGGEALQESRILTRGAHVQGCGHRVVLDHLVRGLSTHPAAHGGHQDLRGGQERQVLVQLALHNGLKNTELIEDGEHGFEHPVDREERVGKHDPAHHRAVHVPLVPLRAREV